MVFGGFLAGVLVAAVAQEVRILSLSQNGLLVWTNASLNVTCRVEWASSLAGPWSSTWESLTNLVITNSITQCRVPMFYRVVSTAPPVPTITPVAAAEALALLTNHLGEAKWVFLDVRTPAEYASRHIRTAVNVDFYSAAFESELNRLDKAKSYLVYCASGNRSRQASEIMRRFGFLQVYNLLTGFGTLAALDGAPAFLEP